jgi:hypothetical protein
MRPSESLLSFNIAAAGLADELLSLPSTAAATAIELMYGRAAAVPPAFLARAGTGARIPLAARLSTAAPLATLVAERFRACSAWLGPAPRRARALARERYRELQAALVGSRGDAAPEALASLARYTYDVDGGRWLSEDAARRLLDAVVILNRAALALLASIARGETALDLGVAATGPTWTFDVPASSLDTLAEALPPVAVPDFPAFARALETSRAGIEGDAAIRRYRSLFAEMLGRAIQRDVLA